MSKRRTDSHCFAPGCRSGYPGAPKASLFAAPREDDLRRKWERNLRRDDKPLTETSAVCEHHFEPRYILREYVHVINDCEVRTPRGKPSLVPDAVPTLLPGCPAYLSVAAPKQRPERRKAAKPPEGASRKRRRPDAPDEVSLPFVRKALELDGCSVTLQAMHGITGSHTNPNNFEKMRVSLAFQLFGEKVIHGLQLYKSGIEDTCGDITATLKFFKIIHDLVQMMTSRFPAEALRPSSASVEKLRSFQEYLSSWEDHTKGQKGFLSQSTAAGLRVTVSSVLFFASVSH
ncbi:hypothetical protein HPB51_004844 [Rhipicephalus microplus]|uniref:THAP-type domain-containing protein n=2 Tax=Rhipicephalus microplus TaxID=6941 RepID=A0A9J6DKN5_RHIMP|nr:hypothetical protein HPB51_004844 [Rhipicephalus microplus]